MSQWACRLLGYLVVQGVLIVFATAWPAGTEGQDLFEKRCVVCHQLPDPGQPPPVGWEKQLELMGPLARLEPAQREDVLEYLRSHSRDAAMNASLDEDRLLFEEKCSRCHSLDRILMSELNGDDLQHVVNRMQSRSGTDWLSDADVERVLAYLTVAPRETTPSSPLDGAAAPEQIFSARCSACHSLERIFSLMGDREDASEFWSHTISRMRGKAPQWMSESEALEILEYLRSMSPDAP